MNAVQTPEQIAGNKLRLWPGVVAVVLEWLLRFGVPSVFPDVSMFVVLGGLACGLAVVVWWVFFSRAAWVERLGAVLVTVIAFWLTSRLVHVSIANGMMGLMLLIYAIPVLSLAFVAWAVATRNLSNGVRRVSMVITMVLASGLWTLLRTDGITGAGAAQFAWRWSSNPEQRLLAESKEKARALPQSGMVMTNVADWPGFRGPERDGVVRGMRIETDWSRSPPVELWRRQVGPGWSSFAVEGDVFYTQEQRGEEEVVGCYKMTTGEPVWRHSDAIRFWESNGGAGPRATPTFSNGRLYTFGATGLLNALEASNGAVVWSHNAASDSGTKVPGWAFSSSPLVMGDVVIVAASGRMIGYDITSGKLRWLGPAHGGSYSSPHRLTIDSVQQVVLLSDNGVTSLAPQTGTLLWEYSWPGVAILQPALIEGGILIATGGSGGGVGTRRLAITHGAGGWTTQERWTSTGLKPYFNDLVVHKTHAYGFDGSLLACIRLQDGKREWKDGRYGNGQLVLLPEQDLLLIISEKGEIALANASADGFKELARVPAIRGKTWNHPVVVGNQLLVRNDQEMAAFRLLSNPL